MSEILRGPTEFLIKDPIVKIEAKAKTSPETEALVAISFLGEYGRSGSKHEYPSAEMLEALGRILELAEYAYKDYKEHFVQYQLHLAEQMRLPQADGDDGDTTNVLPFKTPDYTKGN